MADAAVVDAAVAVLAAASLVTALAATGVVSISLGIEVAASCWTILSCWSPDAMSPVVSMPVPVGSATSAFFFSSLFRRAISLLTLVTSLSCCFASVAIC